VWSQSAASLAVQVQQILDPLHGRGDCLLWHDLAGQIKPALANHEGFQQAVHPLLQARSATIQTEFRSDGEH
jgi:hypothetical protein